MMPPEIGFQVAITRTFTAQDVLQFAQVSGDTNPLHLDAAYAASTIFKRPVVHGMLVGSLFSQILGTRYPGLGSIYLQQNLRFLKPVFVGESVQAIITLTAFDATKNRGTFTTEVLNADGLLAVIGVAEVLFPKV
jgi:acyl dehydratase